MPRSRSAFFTARVAAFAGVAAVTIAVPLFSSSATSGAEPNQPPPTTSTSATTDGHGWIE
jgi:hypothetical protein